VIFYFDYISHNAYLAWWRLDELEKRYEVQFEFVPVLFAGLLNAHGQLGPAEIPSKAWWMAKDVMRKAALLGVPLMPPASHPFNPLLPLRVSSIEMSAVDRRKVVGALFNATWGRSRDVSDPEVVSAVLDEAEFNGEDLVSRAGSREVKDRLRDQTDAAIARGVFGVPTVRVDDEIFWGYDDFPHLELHLAGEDPLDRAVLEGWGRIQPTARRRRPGD
jgi:2-hydroxychromene-2-carboxylate isomerase